MAVWAGVRIVFPKGCSDRQKYLAQVGQKGAVYRFTTPCGRKVAYRHEDIPAFDVRCHCGKADEFLVRWSEGETKSFEA